LKRSTGSGTGSGRRNRSSLRFKLFIAIISVALACVLVSALLSGLVTRHQMRKWEDDADRETGGMDRGRKNGAQQVVTLGFITAGLLGLLLAFVLSYVLAYRISKPLSELTRATGSMAEGDYTGRVNVSGEREVEELADAFNSLSDSLESNEALRKNMVADIAHELRSPIATIRAQLEAVEDGVIEADRSTVDSLMEDTVMLTRLVEDLQQLSMIESGQLELDLVPLDPGETARRATSRFESELGAGGIELGVEVSEGLPRVKADQLRIAQVLGNLLKNSIMHTAEGGGVTVEVEESGGEVVFSVSDTGTGIEEDELPMIFERFYRPDRSRARATGGAGLGLSIARSLVEAQGGRIWAESEPGKGTTVLFTVPVFREQEQ